ncbi:MAG: PA14 domain-containing protein, partial [Candidatus Saccharibacteria bacterium]
PLPPPTPALACPGPANNSFSGCYYSDPNFNRLSLIRNDQTVNFDWGSGSPGAGLPADSFSARWDGKFNFSPGRYTFSLTGDDGVRLYVDGALLINQWKDQPATTYRASKRLSSGTHRIRVEYYEKAGGAVAKLSWTRN